jgi:hypothetical protein
MTAEKLDDILSPKLEELAAYVDGELDAPRRREVEAWLADHSDLAVDVQQQRRLADVWRATAPAQPSEAQWDGVLAEVQSSAMAISWPRAFWRRSAVSVTLAVIGTAAVLLLAFSFLRWHRPPAGFPNDDSRFRPGMPDRSELVQSKPIEHLTFISNEADLEGHSEQNAGSNSVHYIGLRLPGKSLQIER